MVKKRQSKQQRIMNVLLGLVDLYLETGKPIGSHTLQESAFKNISSATIRNYCATLEKEGYLKQQHTSGGRIPTANAYKFFAQSHYHHTELDPADALLLSKELKRETPEVARYLQNAGEVLSELSQMAVFISSPRFDQDFITQVKLMPLDYSRTLAALMTQFGLIHTEILFWPQKIHTFSLKRIEAYFQFRLTDLDEPKLSIDEKKIAEHFYNEIFLRHIVKYSSFYNQDVYKTGFSKLLQYPELRDAKTLTQSLALFENPTHLKALLSECRQKNALSIWVEEDLSYYLSYPTNCTVVAIPYTIFQKPVGAIALLGPSRLPYKKLIALTKRFSELLSENITKSLSTFKITFREPQTQLKELSKAECLLLEDQHGDK